jgi:hypothetical protein
MYTSSIVVSYQKTVMVSPPKPSSVSTPSHHGTFCSVHSNRRSSHCRRRMYQIYFKVLCSLSTNDHRAIFFGVINFVWFVVVGCRRSVVRPLTPHVSPPYAPPHVRPLPPAPWEPRPEWVITACSKRSTRPWRSWTCRCPGPSVNRKTRPRRSTRRPCRVGRPP